MLLFVETFGQAKAAGESIPSCGPVKRYAQWRLLFTIPTARTFVLRLCFPLFPQMLNPKYPAKITARQPEERSSSEPIEMAPTSAAPTTPKRNKNPNRIKQPNNFFISFTFHSKEHVFVLSLFYSSFLKKSSPFWIKIKSALLFVLLKHHSAQQSSSEMNK